MEDFLNTPIFFGQSLAQLLDPDLLTAVVGNVLAAIGILIAGFIVSRWVSRKIHYLGLKYESLDDTLFNFLSAIARYAILIFSVIFVLNTFGVRTTSFVAVIGAAGLAIGLALQGTLSNVAAGVMIILFRPFKLGDFIEISGQSGSVKNITLNFTEIASVGNVQIFVPNAQVWGNLIVNYSCYPLRRAEWTFGVGYGANLSTAKQVILDTIMSDPRSLSSPDPFIEVNNLNASSVDFLVRVWVSSSDYFLYQAEMKRKVKEALDAAGVDIPFPTRTVVMQQAEAAE